jgi:probable phosphoglycerate mutase
VRLVLVRHGETSWNAEGRFQGHGGVGLNELGEAQAKVTAEVLARAHPDAALILRSDSERVAETSAFTEAQLDVPVRVDERLREIDVGSWSGLTMEEIAEQDPDGYDAWARSDPGSRRGGGETYAELRDRVWQVLSGLPDEFAGRTVIVFTHGGPIRVAVACALGLDAGREHHIAGMENCALSLLEWKDGTPRLRAYNRIEHLP